MNIDAALASADLDPADAEAFRRLLTDPAVQYARLPIPEQKQLTLEQALQVADWFLADAHLGYVHDPMDAWFRFGGKPWACHDRALPTYALTLILTEVLDADTAEQLAVFAWRIPEWPEANGGTDAWRAAWQRVGFTSDTEDVTAPTDTLTLYRGAVPKHKRGMAWTGDLHKARWFARRFPKSDFFGQGRVYAADVTPDRVFARILGRGEDEWVIDTRRLPIRTVEVPRG